MCVCLRVCVIVVCLCVVCNVLCLCLIVWLRLNAHVFNLSWGLRVRVCVFFVCVFVCVHVCCVCLFVCLFDCVMCCSVGWLTNPIVAFVVGVVV